MPDLCPYCGEPLKPDTEELAVRGVSLGRFSGLRCPKCGEFFYPVDARNERGESAEDAAKRAGVWGGVTANTGGDVVVSTVDRPGRARASNAATGVGEK